MSRLQSLYHAVVCVYKCLAFPVPGGGRALCVSGIEGMYAGHGCHRAPCWTLMCPCPRPRGLRAPGCRGFLYVGVAPCLSTSAVAVNAPLNCILQFIQQELVFMVETPPSPKPYSFYHINFLLICSIFVALTCPSSLSPPLSAWADLHLSCYMCRILDSRA